MGNRKIENRAKKMAFLKFRYKAHVRCTAKKDNFIGHQC